MEEVNTKEWKGFCHTKMTIKSLDANTMGICNSLKRINYNQDSLLDWVSGIVLWCGEFIHSSRCLLTCSCFLMVVREGGGGEVKTTKNAQMQWSVLRYETILCIVSKHSTDAGYIHWQN